MLQSRVECTFFSPEEIANKTRQLISYSQRPKQCRVWGLHLEKKWHGAARGALRGRSLSVGRREVEQEAVCVCRYFLPSQS